MIICGGHAKEVLQPALRQGCGRRNSTEKWEFVPFSYKAGWLAHTALIGADDELGLACQNDPFGFGLAHLR